MSVATIDHPSGHPQLASPIDRIPGDDQRLRQLDRVLLLITFLSPLKRGATLDELFCDLNDEVVVCKRTVYRDLRFLIRYGYVDRVKSQGSPGHPAGYLPLRYVWKDNSVRGVIIRHLADVREAAL